jgi:hypothetical protein
LVRVRRARVVLRAAAGSRFDMPAWGDMAGGSPGGSWLWIPAYVTDPDPGSFGSPSIIFKHWQLDPLSEMHR